MKSVVHLKEKTNIETACAVLGVPRATYYRWVNRCAAIAPKVQRKPPLSLSIAERETVLNILNSERFVDYSPGEAYATLLDEGQYYCSKRTMYRILSQAGELTRRREIKRNKHQYAKPELLATHPNQVWSWDITKLKGPAKWNHFHLYVIMDIYSRCVVGWMVAPHESAALAQLLISETCQKQRIAPAQLTLHADRGSSMKSKLVAQLLADLGVVKTHSRPYTSDDNPFSESQFKTLKYCPAFPKNFGSIEDARVFCKAFFKWYNQEHRHSGINWLTPENVHYGKADAVLFKREQTLESAFKRHPCRFKNKKPSAGIVPEAVWINPPKNEQKETIVAA